MNIARRNNTFTLTLTRNDFAEPELFDDIAFGDDTVTYVVEPFTRDNETLFSVAFDPNFADADTFTYDDFVAQFTADTAAQILSKV